MIEANLFMVDGDVPLGKATTYEEYKELLAGLEFHPDDVYCDDDIEHQWANQWWIEHRAEMFTNAS